jgi:hypothetical protein
VKFARDLLFMLTAAILAVVIILVVEKMIVPVDNFAPTKRGMFSLEVAVLFVLIGSYVYAEVLHGLEFLRRKKPPGGVHIGLNFRDVFLILLSLAGSLSIYLAVIRMLDLS